MTTTIVDIDAIPAIDHRSAMTLAEEEARRLLDLVDRLSDQDWSRPTDCEGWDVKALLSHVLGGDGGERSHPRVHPPIPCGDQGGQAQRSADDR